MSDKWIVFFGEDWGRLNSTGQYLARALAGCGYKILWVNSIGLRTPRMNRADIGRIFTKLLQFAVSLVKRMAVTQVTQAHGIPDNIMVVTPLALPFYKYRLIRRINRFLVGGYLRGFLKRFGVTEPIVMTANPSTVDVVDRLGAKLIIYYCADEYSVQPGVDTHVVQNLESELLKKADMVFASARTLHEAKSRMHKNVHYLPHGVNYAHLRSALDKVSDVPDDMPDLATPCIGYVGLIGEHLDLDLIAYVADAMPDVNVVMVGPVESGLGRLPRRENISYLGAKSYAEVPRYMAHCDVCILPWNDGIRNRYAHPTKLREYLASGCPVVTTPHQEVYGVSNDVYIGETKEAFVRHLRALTTRDNVRSRYEISAAVENHDWSSRAKEMLSRIGET